MSRCWTTGLEEHFRGEWKVCHYHNYYSSETKLFSNIQQKCLLLTDDSNSYHLSLLRWKPCVQAHRLLCDWDVWRRLPSCPQHKVTRISSYLIFTIQSFTSFRVSLLQDKCRKDDFKWAFKSRVDAFKHRRLWFSILMTLHTKFTYIAHIF